MSFLVLAGIVGGVAAAGAIAVGLRRALRRRSAGLPSVAPPALEASPAPQPPDALSFGASGLSLGDVVMLGRGEAWLTGAMRLMEGGEDEVCLFFTDESADGDVLLVRPVPRRRLFLLRAVALDEAAFSPHTLEHERDLFTRKRRVPVALELHGRGCPVVGDDPIWAWFESPGGEVIVSLQWARGSLAWRGREVDEGSTLLLAAGQATFRR